MPGHSEPRAEQPGVFATTHWSVVLAAREGVGSGAEAALETLCRTYWYPLYAFIRRKRYSVEEAQDLTQEFLARLLEKEYLKVADRQRGRFRTFLLSSLENFLINEWRRASRLKRGGGRPLIPLDAEAAEGRYALEPVDDSTPDKLFEKRWAATLLEQAMARLQAEFGAGGREPLFEEMKVFLWGDRNEASQTEVAARLGLTSGAMNVAVYRLRRRYRELLREEIAHTVANESDVDEELRHLKAVLSS